MTAREALLEVIKRKVEKTGSADHKENAAGVIRRRLDPSFKVSDVARKRSR